MFRSANNGGFLSVGCGIVSAVISAYFPPPVEAQSAEAWWGLGPAELSIGEHSDSDLFFEDIVDMFVRGDRLYVADRGSRSITALDRATGQVVATTGRRGEGPGEFRFLGLIDDCGQDAVFASDIGLDRVTMFSLDLDLIRTIPLPHLIYKAIRCAGASTFVGIARNEDPLLATLSGSSVIPTEPWRANLAIAFLAPDGARRKVLGPFPGQERYRIINVTQTGYTDFPLRWGLDPVFDFSANGVVIGTGDTFSLVRYDVEGNVVDTLAVDQNRVAVSQSHINAFVQDRTERSGNPARARVVYADYPFPSHFPAYSNVVIAADGFVWVEQYPLPFVEQPTHWKVFAPEGALAATVDVPRDFRVMWVGETHVAGVVTDELDVQSVEVRPIVRD